MIHEAMSSDSSELEGPPTVENLPLTHGPIPDREAEVLHALTYFLWSWLRSTYIYLQPHSRGRTVYRKAENEVVLVRRVFL